MNKNNLETVSSSAVLDVIDTCTALGVMSDQDLTALSLIREELSDPTLRLAESRLIEIWQWVASNSAIPEIGVMIGSRINPEAKGVLASWVSQCETLAQALDVFINNIAIMSPSERWTMDCQNDLCTLTFHLDQTKGYPDIAIERSLCSMVAWGRLLSAQQLDVSSVRLTFDKPAYHNALVAVLGEHIEYRAPFNSISFDSHYLSAAINSRSRYLQEIAQKSAEQTMQGIYRDNAVSRQVEKIIISRIGRGDISIDSICEQMSVSRQALYNKLKKEGTCYQDIFDAVRKRMALNLLSDSDGDITYTSFSLGFKDTSSFYKAFKRWFSTGPKNYRQLIDKELSI